MKNKNQYFKLILCLLVVVTALASCKKNQEAPMAIEDRVTQALFQSQGPDHSHTLSNFSAVVKAKDGETQAYPAGLFKILDKLQITGDLKRQTIDKPVMTLALDLSYNQDPLLSLETYADAHGIAFRGPDFTDTWLDFPLEDTALYAPKSQSLMDTYRLFIDLPLLKTCFSDLSASSLDLLRKHLKDHLSNGREDLLVYTYEATTYKEKVTLLDYTFSLKSILDLAFDLLDSSKPDDPRRKYAYELSKNTLKMCLETDIYQVSIDHEDFFSDACDRLESAPYDMKVLKEVMQDLVGLENYSDNANNFKVQLAISPDNRLKKVLVQGTYDTLDYTLETINHSQETLVIAPLQEKINFVKLQHMKAPYDEDLGQDRLLDMLKSALDYINASKAFHALMDDLKPLEPYTGLSVTDIKITLGIAQVYLRDKSFEDLKDLF